MGVLRFKAIGLGRLLLLEYHNMPAMGRGTAQDNANTNFAVLRHLALHLLHFRYSSVSSAADVGAPLT